MKSGWTGLCIVVAAAGPIALRAQEPEPPPAAPRAWLGIAAQYGRATGEFASYVRDGGGVTGNLTIGLGAGGNIGLRLSGHGLIYGSQTRRYSLLPGITADVTTSNVIAGLMVGPQLSAGSRSVRAYGFGGVGFNYFATTSEVTGSGNVTPFASSTNFDDITLAIEAGGGLQLRLSRTVYLDLGARYLSNGRVNYVTRDGVTVVGNNLVVNPVNSEVTLVAYHVGISLGVPTPGPSHQALTMPAADLARALLDTPRWVETRFMLLQNEAVVTGLTGDRRHFVAESLRWPLVSVVGRPDRAFIAGAVQDADEDLNVLCAEEDADHVGRALPDWTRIGSTIHAWPGDVPLPAAPASAEARLLGPDELAALRHVPADLHDELLIAAEYSPVAGAFAGGAPVAFCCASAITETLWDIGIDTLDGYRRRGLALKAAQLLIATLGERGKWPVWGSEDGNTPSLALARKMGFVPVERLIVVAKSLKV